MLLFFLVFYRIAPTGILAIGALFMGFLPQEMHSLRTKRLFDYWVCKIGESRIAVRSGISVGRVHIDIPVVVRGVLITAGGCGWVDGMCPRAEVIHTAPRRGTSAQHKPITSGVLTPLKRHFNAVA